MNGEQRPVDDNTGSAFEDAACAAMFRQTMGPQAEACRCPGTMDGAGASGCCAEMMPRMKAACRKLVFYAALAVVTLIGGAALLAWVLFQVVGA